ncbi:histidine kinase dimerization/phosphoacceptor domain -containing protein [Sphingosinicella sp. GR2756]|uniref:histidine kinase n=2 Tax=Sphingosinicella rhizophila TaxID=3050082 RepID=A0ABU3Q8I7_9SPHN|nr:histidine kinase dimerization/phosphoacceptor domain -containing protein [Sphingosinicella sp. GR2756]
MLHPLIIEDESLIAMSIEAILRDCGFTSFSLAKSSEEAITAAQPRCPDLITADVQLRPGCGIESVNAICSGPPIPTIFVIGSPSEVVSRMPQHLMVVKPFSDQAVMRARQIGSCTLSKAKLMPSALKSVPVTSTALGMALIASSNAPLLLLAEDLTVIAASSSFCCEFGIDPATVEGTKLANLGAGEWDVPQLNSLLEATLGGAAAIDAYEMDLVREGEDSSCLLLNAHKLDYGDEENPRIVLAVTDITSARLAEKLKDDLLQRNQILLQELQHRVANSLQIIASVLMQSARRVQSEETRTHLHNAHHRVMSIATLQKQLAIRSTDKVELRKYLKELCASIGASMIDDPDRVSLVSKADDTVTTANVSVSLGLIVTELVINSLKHAFPGRNQKGKINVGYLTNDGGWTLTVEDDGSGMSVEDDAKPGLGTGIVEALARQLDATVKVTDRHPGTKVSVVRAP